MDGLDKLVLGVTLVVASSTAYTVASQKIGDLFGYAIDRFIPKKEESADLVNQPATPTLDFSYTQGSVGRYWREGASSDIEKRIEELRKQKLVTS